MWSVFLRRQQVLIEHVSHNLTERGRENKLTVWQADVCFVTGWQDIIENLAVSWSISNTSLAASLTFSIIIFTTKTHKFYGAALFFLLFLSCPFFSPNLILSEHPFSFFLSFLLACLFAVFLSPPSIKKKKKKKNRGERNATFRIITVSVKKRGRGNRKQR